MAIKNPNIIKFPYQRVRNVTPQSDQFQEYKKWFIKYRLKNGLEGCYAISASEKEDLYERLPTVCEQKDLGFFEFESKTHRIIIQPTQLIFFQFLFEPLRDNDPQNTDEEEENVDHYLVKIYTTDNPNPLIFHVDEDIPDPEDEGDEGEMNNFIFYALNVYGDEQMLHFTDEDGETAFFRGSSIALIEIPLKVLKYDKS